MVDSEALLPDKKEERRMNNLTWTYYISLALSIIAILLAVVSVFKKPVIADAILYTTAVSNVAEDVKVGDVVSLNSEGKVQLGEGTTIMKNVLYWKEKSMSHLYSTNVGNNILVVAYDGYINVNYIDNEGTVTEGTTTPLPSVAGGLFSVDDLITLSGNTVLLIGRTNLLPINVTWSDGVAGITFGNMTRFTQPDSYQPVIDTLGDRCFAISYFYTESSRAIKLATRTGCVDMATLSLTLNEEVLYSDNHMFHGIAGLSETKFVLAKACSMTGDNDLKFQLATVEGTTVKVGKEVVLKNRTNFGFFDMDNLNDHQVVVTFIDGDMNNGLETVMLIYNKARDTLMIGPYLDNQDGGASGMSDKGVYNFIKVRVMSETRFAVFYSNIALQGATALSMGEVTPAGDLIAAGPEYVLSSPMVEPNRQYYWLGECAMFNNRLVLVESLTSEDVSQAHSELHLIDVKSMPLGIVVDKSSSSVSIAVAGVVQVSSKLEQGYNYYGDSKGRLLKGEYVGAMNTEVYYIYVETEDGTLLSDDNRVGFALNDNSLYLKVHNCCVCWMQKETVFTLTTITIQEMITEQY